MRPELAQSIECDDGIDLERVQNKSGQGRRVVDFDGVVIFVFKAIVNIFACEISVTSCSFAPYSLN